MTTPPDLPTHPAEPHHGAFGSRLNWLRAGVLGANDGIVSTAGIVVGVAAASTERGPIFTAGIAALAAGALSMAVGEYVSVSTQRDSEKAMLTKERRELDTQPAEELDELAALYEAKGLSPATARTVELSTSFWVAPTVAISGAVNTLEATVFRFSGATASPRECHIAMRPCMAATDASISTPVQSPAA